MPDDRPEDTQPEVHEVYDADRALKTMAEQVASIYGHMPTVIETQRMMQKQQEEHERRIKVLEAKEMEHERRLAALEQEKAAE